jgi:hypothetical protein
MPITLPRLGTRRLTSPSFLPARLRGTGLLPALLLAGGMAVLALAPVAARAQASCSSDGQRAPVALLERFINADCASCWAAADTPRPPRGTLALDWIVPGTEGDNAPLSAAASRDALARLQALQRPVPAISVTSTLRVTSAGATRLRVAHGLPLGGYIGASIDYRPSRPGREPVTAWLALVETIPAGTEGSPVERHLVRNVLQTPWNDRASPSRSVQKRFIESRPLNIPEGARPERLRVVGWVEDTKGRMTAMAQSQCHPASRRR